MTIFGKIIRGEIPCNKVLENEDFLAFHDINPKAPIHILIIPKEYYENIQVMDHNKMGDMFKFIQELTRILGVDKSGYRLITNCGKDGCQEVMHLHFHLLAGKKLN